MTKNKKGEKMQLENNTDKFISNFATIFGESQEIAQDLFKKSMNKDNSLAMEEEAHIGKAFMDATTKFFANPTLVAEKQKELWQDYAELANVSFRRMMGEEVTPVAIPNRHDRRFNDDSWSGSTIYDFIKQSYLLNSNWLMDLVNDIEGIDKHTKMTVDFYTEQILNAISPSNFVMTNPEVLRKAIETNGDSLAKGVHNLAHDIHMGKISVTDVDKFKVGENVACTKGSVVYQNDMMQLIQYAPTTKTVYEVPLLVVPAWINKYYILDLSEKNSFVKWLVDQGFTVFMISWKNPDESMADKGFENYLLEGPIDAINQIEKATGSKEVTMMGYCLGGTLTNIALAYLEKKDDNRVKGATFLTTLIDFSDIGDLSVFIDEEQISILETKMNEKGYLDASEMALTFAMLKSNDLIWSYVVNNYLLGKDPFPFDILYWNSDSTRLPAKMHSYYLRNMYMDNNLIKPNKLKIDGVNINLNNIDTPVYMLSTKSDHIAPWEATYAATQFYKGSVKFVLAASGHIAGIVNHPDKNKYCFWSNDKIEKTADKWLEKAHTNEGSWWSDWKTWNAKNSGKKITAKKVGSGKLKEIETAPGSYVKKQY